MSDSLIITIAGLSIAAIAVIGGVVELFKQRVVVDSKGGVTHIEIPGFGKIKTNYPSVAAIFLGVVIVALVLNWADVEIEKMPFTATVTVNNPDSQEKKTADVFISVIPQRNRRSQSGVNINEKVIIKFDIDKDEEYDVIIYTPVYIRSDGTVQRAMQFGPMKIKHYNGSKIGTYEAELKIQ